MAACTPGKFDLNCWLMGKADILANIVNSLGPIQKLVVGATYVIGLAFLFKAIYTLKVYGEARTMMASNANVKEPLIYLLVGSIFIYLPTGIELILRTAFGSSAEILAYAPLNSGSSTLAIFGPNSPAGRPLTMLIQVIGLIAFVRGWVLIARSSATGQQPGGFGKGLIHVFGGILALNIVKTLEVINATLFG